MVVASAKHSIGSSRRLIEQDERKSSPTGRRRDASTVIGDFKYSNQTSSAGSGPPLASSRQPLRANGNRQPIRRYYIDELGFYRYLDAEQRQYVCTNVDSINIDHATTTTSTDASQTGARYQLDRKQSSDVGAPTNRTRISASANSNSGELGGLEVCFNTVRHDLGISHFDKTEDYENWKRDWDEFMRVKLISQQPVTLNSDLKNRVRSGIPHDYRCKVWSALIRMRTRMIRSQFGDDIYEAIIRDFVSKVQVPEYLSAGEDDEIGSAVSEHVVPADDSNNNSIKAVSSSKHTPQAKQVNNHQPIIAHKKSSATNNTYLQEPFIDKCFRQIELDLLRTLPNNRHFKDPNSNGIRRVRRVLRAYACFNQTIGYCQGMNRLAAMAMLVLPEEEAFWCLVAIIQCIMPKDYYLKPWLAQVDCCVLSELLEKKLPALHKHLVKNDIQLTLFTWFFTIFVDGFRPELLLRIWDCFLLEGDKVLFRIALAILHISQDELLKMSDFSTMSAHLSRLVSTRKLDVEHLFEIAFNKLNPLSTATLQARRQFHRNKMSLMLDD